MKWIDRLTLDFSLDDERVPKAVEVLAVKE